MILRIVKKVLLLFCIVFTIATLFSCVINLGLGYETDTYVHIIDRAVLTLLGTVAVVLVLEFPFKNKILNFLIPYTVFILLAMVYVFISGLYQQLHPNAYRDVFINDTLAYIAVYACVKAYERVIKRKS